jgi:membrane protease YdiL (CAAX protease family)
MNKIAGFLKPLVPILAAAYGFALIYVTAMPLNGEVQTIGRDLLSMLLTLVCIGLTFFLVNRVEPKLFPSSKQFIQNKPKWSVLVGLLMIAPLWLVTEGYIVYGLTSLFKDVQMESLTYTTTELREDLLASVHAVLLAPVLEELCFRQMPISPFRRRGAQIAVCVVMAILFGVLHVRNFPGAFLSAIVYGLVFIFSRNIWYSVALHAGHNMTATFLALYCWLGLGETQMAKMPVIFLPDIKVLVGSVVLASGGILLIKRPSDPKDCGNGID